MNAGDFDAQTVEAALLGQAEAFRDALLGRIQQKLSGGVLQAGSGALAGSIRPSIETDGSGVSAAMSSAGVPYAAIQEFGGKTAAHAILAMNGKALVFGGSGAQVFAKSAHHPGSAIPARSYLGSSLAEMAGEMTSGFKRAVLAALRGG